MILIYLLFRKTRIHQKDDTFVPFSSQVTADDVEKERQRLNLLEEAAREKVLRQQIGLEQQRQFMAKDRAALKLQCLCRGMIGRMKYKMVDKLKRLALEKVNLIINNNYYNV